MVCGVTVGMPARSRMRTISSSGSCASSALPTPVACSGTRLPTSVNMRIECLPATCAT
jgi:hypothetical protein